MEPFYLLGEPIFNVNIENRRFQAPVGQLKLCQKILEHGQSRSYVVDKLRDEYVAIVQSLVDMGIKFRIIYAHKEAVDKKILSVCIYYFKSKLIDFSPNFFGPSIVCPRDFCTVLPKIVLVNSKVAELMTNDKDGYSCIASPFGEGGRVLHSGKTMLVNEKINAESGNSRFVRDEEIREISDLGIKTARFPSPLGGVVQGDDKNRFFSYDHIDRVGALIADSKQQLHLIVDPGIYTAKWKSEGLTSWDPAGPEETIAKLRTICDPLEIKVHMPEYLNVPYSLNLIQFPNGQVLMTNGDDRVAEMVGGFIGQENVYLTPIPIRYYPVWVYAGIRCMIADAPLPLLKKA